MALSVEEILDAMRALIEAAEETDESMSDEDVERYENLEKQLLAVRRSDETKKRDAAYRSAQIPGAHVATEKKDDTLERAFESYLRTGIVNQDLTELRAQQVGTDSEGGFLVPPGFRDKLVEVKAAFGGFAQHADSFTTSSGQVLEFPSLNDTANVGSITAEEAQFAAGADLVFGTVALGAFKYTSQGTGQDPLRVSVELLQDSEFDVAGLVARALGMRIARKQASDFVVGTGTTLPFGIAHTGLTTDHTLGVEATITYAELLEIEGLLDPAYQESAQWLMNSATWSTIRGLLDGSNRPLILDQAVSGIAGKPAKQLLGYPVIIDNAMVDITDDGALGHYLAFGDFREAYVIRRVANLTVVVNPYTRANFGQVEYVAWERADGNIQNRSAYVVSDNITT